jgi:hypothetical protein
MRVCRPLANAIPGGAGLRPAGRHPQVVGGCWPGATRWGARPRRPGGAGPLALVGDLDPLPAAVQEHGPDGVGGASAAAGDLQQRDHHQGARPAGPAGGWRRRSAPGVLRASRPRPSPGRALAGRGEAARPGPGRPASAHDSMRRVTSSSMPRTGRSSTSDRGDSRPFRCSRSRWLSDTRSTRGPPAGLRARRVSRHDLLVLDLYERLGYETFGVIEGCPAGSAARWYRKDL